MEIATALSELKNLQLKMHAYNHASGMIYLDSVTVAPPESVAGRGQTLAILSEESHKLFANDQVGGLLAFLLEHQKQLSWQEQREAEELQRSYEMLSKIPLDEYSAYAVLINEAESIWHKAKENDDFALFAPYLERVFDFNRRFAAYYDATKAPYDALLDQYERGISVAQLDPFFALLREQLVPLIKEIASLPAPDDSFLFRRCAIAEQRKFSAFLMQLIGLDQRYCGLGESEHPFTIEFNNRDVRITTKYHAGDFTSSMYSVIHEGGHALYELHIADELSYTCLGSGVSMGVHESQSRFYENIIGRSEQFIGYVLPKLQELFPGNFSDIKAAQLYQAVNKVQPSLIRIEADELTYPFHIIIRYQLEKALIDGGLAVADLPAAWHDLYQEYLGVEVTSDKQGVLQDSHWSGGNIGYFPSYALGSAYAAQMLAAMEKAIPVWTDVEQGDLSGVNLWLTDKLHKFGGLRPPAAAVEYAVGAPFDPKHYLNYLQKKYRKIYGI